MKRLAIVAIAVALFAGCAGAPASKAPEAAPAADAPAAVATAAEPAAVPEAAPAKKEPRYVTVRIPSETKSSTFFADGSLDEYRVSEYGADGRLALQARFTASGAPVDRVEFAYEGGRLASKTTFDAEGKPMSKRSFFYDAEGRVLAERLSDAAGKPLSAFEYAYDPAGHRVSWLVKDAKDSVVASTSYAFKDGRIRSAELKDAAGRKTGSSVYEYDADGRLSKLVIYDSKGQVMRLETTAWDGGRIVKEERTTAGGAVLQRTSYQYGKDGETTRKLVEDLAGKTSLSTTYEYSFKEETRAVEE